LRSALTAISGRRRASDRIEAFHQRGIDLDALAFSIVADCPDSLVAAESLNEKEVSDISRL
jgi:hypothetical protein